MPRRAVVLSFDHLHLGFLGCYGNDWIETPNLDRLATQAVVFDRHYVENVDRGPSAHAWWTGRYECLAAPDTTREPPTFLASLEHAEIRTTLIVESDGSDGSAVAPPFEEVIAVRGIDRLGGEESETPFGRLVLRAEEWLRSAPEDGRPSLLWLKSRGVPTPWLPPHEFGELYLEEFGLGKSAKSTTAEGEVDVEEDTADIEEEFDELMAEAPDSKAASPEDERALELRYARALYAAYVSWLDRWLGKFLRTLEESSGWEETLFIVTAAAGQGLGEHAALDHSEMVLRDEFIHTLLIVRLPDRQQDGTRRASLVQAVDLPATLCDWLGVGREVAGPAGAKSVGETLEKELAGKSLLPIIRNEWDAIRDFALLHSATEWGLRTDDFLYVEPKPLADGASEPEALLFEKPYDRWDHSDVAGQYPQSVEALHARLLQCRDLRARRSSASTTPG